MNINPIVRRALIAASLVLSVTVPLSAQPLDPWEVNPDVDNDGLVGPTDIQHVINGALGLTDRGPDAVDRPLRQYVVASPRASLAPLPDTAAGTDPPCTTLGAVSNFPRPNGRLLVRRDTAIAFRYDRNVEGVWHDGACGLLRSELVVEIQRLPETDNTALSLPELDEDAWVEIGRDGAAGEGCGPALGTANIGVRFLFEEGGDFVVRCTIATAAIPEDEIAAGNETPDFCGATRATDRVFTLVRVVNRRANANDLRWQNDEDPNSVGAHYGRQLQNNVDPNVALP